MLPDEDLAGLKSRFGLFAEETRGRSSLYRHLSLAIAEDEEIPLLLTKAPVTQRRPNLLFAAVHDLLLAGADHRLAAYYPSCGGHRLPDGETLPAFRDFAAQYSDGMADRLSSRTTQTNEPGRCVALRPALASLATRSSRPLALVEVGTSAGLLLHLDRYSYRYGTAMYGSPGSDVLIEPELRGAVPAALTLPTIVARLGIDLDPLSPDDIIDARWLRACIWPEDLQRLARVDDALRVARSHGDVDLVTGDLSAELPAVLERLGSEVLACVLHSAALAYLDEPDRERFERHLEEFARHRDLARICFEGPFVEPFKTLEQRHPSEPPEEEYCVLGLTTWIEGQRHDQVLARVHPHGTWLECSMRGRGHTRTDLCSRLWPVEVPAASRSSDRDGSPTTDRWRLVAPYLRSSPSRCGTDRR